MILVRAHIAQQHRRRILLSHNQVGGAIAIHIGGNQTARIFQAQRIQSKTRRLTSSKLPSPLLRNTFTRGPALVSTIAARSTHPSLSISTAVTPHPRIAPVSGSGTRSNRRPMFCGPATLRHSVNPGAPAWVTAMSIHPSLL